MQSSTSEIVQSGKNDAWTRSDEPKDFEALRDLSVFFGGIDTLCKGDREQFLILW